ncbi:amidohydrolase [Pontibacillus litoralis]|uniref:Amidohydrolase n=1 Tax=Pontibacillus litoralis JSM 072002 TaxID=1385512 RepID=A0A0A5GD49_9BACI|nr:amidohydrolase [Pontibacillus litoralis]KGX89128.1 amidohydrolase [Pontibacillus litoralis JSM 072002]
MGELWYGGTIYTMETKDCTVEAVFVNHGKIVATGKEKDLRKHYIDEQTVEYNLQGDVMYPGFVDSHLHIVGHGEKRMRLNLSYYTSVEALKQSLEQQIRQLKNGEWMIGEGWDENQWENPIPIHRRDLDEISMQHPIVLTRVCRHALVANSKALEIAGITCETEQPQGGKIEKDADGLTGLLLDTAQQYIKDVMPICDRQYVEQAITIAIKDLWSNGLVGGHTEDLAYYGSFAKTYQAYLNAIGNSMKFRTHLLVHHNVVDDMQKTKHLHNHPFVEFGAMKIFSDGALGGRTAWLREDYMDAPGQKGVAIHTKETLSMLVKKARKFQMPVAIHAIGDRAMELVVDVVSMYPNNSAMPDRIIHGQIMTERLYPLIANENIVIDIQPTFVASDFPWVIERIGINRLAHAYAWKSMLRHGISCAGGSDAPIEEINPLFGIQAAMARTSYHDQVTYGEEQALSMFEAISLYTTGAAKAIGKQKVRGVIKPNYVADFTIFDRDLYTVSPGNLLQVQVSKTVVDGTIMYDIYDG